MKSEKIKWHFGQFLIEHKVYKEFITNVESPHSKCESVKHLLRSFSPKGWILYAFPWSKTEQGYLYWEDLCYKWIKNVDDLDKL